jgi:LysM repeat protein
MKKLFFILSIVLFVSTSWAQEYINHTVQTGDTVYRLSKKYGVSEAAIFQLNPDAKAGLSIGRVLVIPVENTTSESSAVEFNTHKVRRKETLYSLSKKYQVAEEDLKKYNPMLYSQPLKKGDLIKIPLLSIHKTEESVIKNDTVLVVKQSKITHVVVAKETKYGIAKQYSISEEALVQQNPFIKEGLQIGQVLTIVTVADTQSQDAAVPSSFNYYTVQEKDTFYSLANKFDLTKEQILNWNPKFTAGLQAGMLLKYPKKEDDTASNINSGSYDVSALYTGGKVALADSIQFMDAKNISLLLPFRLNQVPDSSRTIVTAYMEKNRLLNASLDFYTGVLVAIDSANTLGLSTVLNVIDTENDYVKLSKKISAEDFLETHAIIGPMLTSNFEKFVTKMQSIKVPIIAPLSSRTVSYTNNTFQSIPLATVMKDTMIAYLEASRVAQNMVLLTDSKSKEITALLKSKFSDMKVMYANDDAFIVPDHIKKRLVKDSENWILIETKNEGLIVNMVTAINALSADYEIKLFTTSSAKRFENKDVSNYHLANLQYCYPTVDLELTTDEAHPFVEKYQLKYGVTPNRIATRGFDLTFDLLLRLAAKEDLYNASSLGETEYVENKFNYLARPSGGFVNTAFYIARYKEDLTIEQVQ